jgi:hypothetical protein
MDQASVRGAGVGFSDLRDAGAGTLRESLGEKGKTLRVSFAIAVEGGGGGQRSSAESIARTRARRSKKPGKITAKLLPMPDFRGDGFSELGGDGASRRRERLRDAWLRACVEITWGYARGYARKLMGAGSARARAMMVRPSRWNSYLGLSACRVLFDKGMRHGGSFREEAEDLAYDHHVAHTY